ncbi:AraC family transcriptional regulator ligand-binding domain-containing protein [Bradyrhizobium tropiciagri]|uniref:helix-turn-helix domain-containing protein n=1 Tax=Bradyrhizobium tropiciagri TaxID=312253 RepID=UPI001BAE1455|nr:AraC family transcriptional regulator [Bradyrhizobium tropiciagri]MBR0893470.1 AraC family transcriptional regulator ligand-binding domain-containing protein [Bradyrhizobium tropiciagri]
MHQTGYTRASTLGPIAAVVTAAGGSIERVFRRAELPLGLLDAPDALLPLRDHFRLLMVTSRELHDEVFAVRLGRQTSMAGLGIFGRWVAQAPTLLEAIHRAGTSLPHMLQNATQLVVRRHGSEIHWSYELSDPARDGRLQNEMLAIWYMIAVVRHFAGACWLPSRIIFADLPDRLRSPIGALTHTDTASGDAASAIVFDRRLLTAVNPDLGAGDGLNASELGRIFDLPDPEDLPGRLSVLIELELLGRRPTLSRIGSRSGLTPRTLQRRLGEAGLSYRDLLRNALQRRAVKLLCENDRSIGEIASMLGYDDPAHFSRAFERWSGAAPTRWRRLLESGVRPEAKGLRG